MHDPTDPVGRLLLNVVAMVAAFEADYLQQAAVWDAVPAEPVCLLETTGAPR